MSDQEHKKILIVEDEKPMARALSLKLESNGFDVSTAGNGTEALEAITTQTFDLIILDLVIPGMDGFAILGELKSRKITTPVIAASNLGQIEDINRAKELGATHYFVKSNTSLAQIMDQVKEILKI
jgi:two-component system alkaline phosphatase synthesis response regulator PhoP